MQEGITFLISSHYLDELARLATWFGFLNHGKLIREVSREKMEQDCRHKMILTVSNRQAFLRVMEERKIPYQLVDGDEAEIYQDIPVSRRIGIAKGRLKTPEDLDRDNEEIVALFGGKL